MEVCSHCGALESARVVHTRTDSFGNVIRYRCCSKCRRKMPALILLKSRTDAAALRADASAKT